MALLVSRRLLRSFGSVLASGSCDSPSILCPSFFASHGNKECILVVICLSLHDWNIFVALQLLFFYLYFGPTHFCVHVSGVISSSEEFSAVSKVFFHHRHVDFSISIYFFN